MDKVELRINHIPWKKKITVLDTFHGAGTIWKSVERKIEKEIQVIGIDKERGKGNGLQREGDNIKFIATMGLELYDVIDLDAYGIPYQILREIFKNGTAKPGAAVFATFIQSIHGRLPNAMLKDLGYTNAMMKKAPLLLCRSGFDKFKQYLGNQGIRNITYIQKNRKYYLHFKIPG